MTLLLSIPFGRAVNSILRGKVFSLLKESGHPIVILSPFSKNQDFINEFKGDHIRFEELEYRNSGSNGPRMEWFSWINLIDACLFLPLGKELGKQVSVFLFRKTKKGLAVGRVLAARACLMCAALVLAALGTPLRWARLLDRRSLNALLTEAVYGLDLRKYKRELEKILRKYPFDLICVTKMFLAPVESLLVALGKKRGIPTLGVFTHLDGLTFVNAIKGNLLPACMKIPHADKTLIQSDTLKGDLVTVHHFKEASVEAVGDLKNDVYFDFLRNGKVPRDIFFEREGLDGARKLIVLMMPSLKAIGPALELIRGIAANVLCDRFGIPCQLWVRMHPLSSPKDFALLCNAFRTQKNIRIQWPGKVLRESGVVQEELGGADQDSYFQLLTHADVVTVGVSSVAVDTALLNKPAVSVEYLLLPPARREEMDSLRAAGDLFDVFVKYILPSRGVQSVRTIADYVAALENYLRDPELDAAGRRELVRKLCGSLDGNVSGRVVETIGSMAGAHAAKGAE